PEFFLEAIAIFNERSPYPLIREPGTLRAMFADAFVRSVERDRERMREALEAAQAEEIEADDLEEAEEAAEEEPFVMTPEIFASMIRGNVYGLARHFFRIRWMQRL